MTNTTQNTANSTATNAGPGRILVAVYGVFALAAIGRSIMQVAQSWPHPPLPYLLSALAAVVYIVATVALALGDRARLALATIGFELFGVLAVGIWSYADTARFDDKTVWSHFGQGYGYIPLVLPIVGLWWLLRRDRADRADRSA